MGEDTDRKHEMPPNRAERRRLAKAAAKDTPSPEEARRIAARLPQQVKDQVVLEYYERMQKWHLPYNAERILFGLVELAADPHLTEAPPITVEQWADHFDIRTAQVTYAFRELARFGIPKPPSPVPLGGLLRFLAGKLKAMEREWGVRAAESVPGDGKTHEGWIEEYFKSQSGGDA